LAEMNLEELVVEARSGSSRALEELVLRIQDQVFALSLRMLYHPSDAEDASQEILIKVITNLHGFRFEGPFRGWVMRIAANHLKATRKRASEQKGLDLERAQARLDKADARGWFVRPLEAPAPLLEAEMRAACMQALMLCLDREHRLAFILGTVMDIGSQEGAYVMDIAPAAFRKRLSRARAKILAFLKGNCDLFEKGGRCRCGTLGAGYVENGWLDLKRTVFAAGDEPEDGYRTLRDYLADLDDLQRVSALFKESPRKKPSNDLAEKLKTLLSADKYSSLLQGDGESGGARH
jgi:RNA polymerase sigma factor (sigma-70 family)